MPSSPYAGPGVGLFIVPPVGANVWVEFEGGDLDYPIVDRLLLGAAGSRRRRPARQQVKVLKTDGA